MLDARLFIQNRKKLSQLLPPQSVAVICSNDPMPRNGDQFFPFRQHSDLFYCTGINQEKTLLILAPSHPDKRLREVLFLLDHDKSLERWEGKKLDKDTASRSSGITEVHWLGSGMERISEIIGPADQILFNIPPNGKVNQESKNWSGRLMDEYTQRFPEKKTASLAPLMKHLRLVKEPAELDAMREACRITKEGFFRAFSLIRPGIGEYELEAEITALFIRNQAAHAFTPILATGMNACTLHYSLNKAKLGKGDLLLMDFGAEYLNYASDCTRTVPVIGRFTPRQVEVYMAVLDIQQKMIQRMTAGTTIENLNKEARLLFEEKLLQLGLLDKKDLENQDPEIPAYKKYTLHGLSHFIGLDVHDPGDQQIMLKPGMVLSCEPGIYIPDEAMGIRIEDQVLITDKEPEVLTAAIPVQPDELCAALYKRRKFFRRRTSTGE